MISDIKIDETFRAKKLGFAGCKRNAFIKFNLNGEKHEIKREVDRKCFVVPYNMVVYIKVDGKMELEIQENMFTEDKNRLDIYTVEKTFYINNYRFLYYAQMLFNGKVNFMTGAARQLCNLDECIEFNNKTIWSTSYTYRN
jgi:hypothetical protein